MDFSQVAVFGFGLELFGFQFDTDSSSASKEMANISFHNGFWIHGGIRLDVGGYWRFALLNEATTLSDYSRLTDKK